MLPRRGFLQMLGISPFAGPSIANELIQTLSTSETAKPRGDSFDIASSGPIFPDDGNGARYCYNRIQETHKLYSLYKSPSDKIYSEWALGYYKPGNLDPDLYVNRSLALTAKFREQKKRDFKKYIDYKCQDIGKTLTSHITNYLGLENGAIDKIKEFMI